MNFLQEVAKQLYQQEGEGISNCAIIFPNKRPAIYFRKYLGELISKPLWSPDLFTIHEFIQESTRQLPADRLLCSFLLFEAYQEVWLDQQLNPISFERFYPLGEILLNDFSELESNVVSIQDVYTNLAELAALDQGLDYLTEEQLNFLKGFWKNFSVEHLSKQKQRFLQLWRNLPSIFERFKAKLKAREMITTGMIYRSLVTGEQDIEGFPSNWKKLVFVGFNALNRAELQLFKKWEDEGRAIFYFDTDLHYVEDELQEAGRFIRRNLNLFKNQLQTENNIRRSDLVLRYIAAEGNSTQARMLPALLESIPGIKEEPEQTAILLADENQLLPVLHALPGWIGQLNITMGYGLVQSPLYSLIQTLVHLQESLHQSRGKSVYYQPLLQLVQHPYLFHLGEAKQLTDKIQQNGLVSIPAQTWEGLMDVRLVKALQLVQQPSELIVLIREILEDHMEESGENRNNSLDLQLIQAAHAQLNRLQDLLATISEAMSLSFVGEILLQVMRSQSVPLEGEPLSGLQVMGLLESRALDFKHIILLNVNEGILPKKAVAPTLIPDSIRRAYGLSVLENQDAIFAYVFYRLLQRSETVHCLYNTAVNEKGMAEKSRFLTQLEYETAIPIERKSVKLDINPQAKPAIVIEKDDMVFQTLGKFSNKESVLSPSALNTYLECRLRFYFQYVQRIREPEERADEITPRELGNFLHKAMEFLYQALENKKTSRWVEPGDFEWLDQQVDQCLKEALGEELAGDRKYAIEYTGTLRVVEEVVRIYIREVLKQDKKLAPFELIDQEKKIAHPLTFVADGKRRTIWLGGYIDRIDRKDGVYRIIDYKTGSDKKEFSSVADLFERDRVDRNKAALQTLLYAKLLSSFYEAQPDSSNTGQVQVQAGLYNVRSMRSEGEDFDWRLSEKAGGGKLETSRVREIGTELMAKVQEILEEIFNRDQPFDQTTRREKCEYCPYQTICGR